jgi:hypothetical protein
MVAQVQKQVTQFGSRMLATFPALGVFRKETPKRTSGQNLQRFLAQL